MTVLTLAWIGASSSRSRCCGLLLEVLGLLLQGLSLLVQFGALGLALRRAQHHRLLLEVGCRGIERRLQLLQLDPIAVDFLGEGLLRGRLARGGLQHLPRVDEGDLRRAGPVGAAAAGGVVGFVGAGLPCAAAGMLTIAARANVPMLRVTTPANRMSCS